MKGISAHVNLVIHWMLIIIGMHLPVLTDSTMHCGADILLLKKFESFMYTGMINRKFLKIYSSKIVSFEQNVMINVTLELSDCKFVSKPTAACT